MTEDEMVGWHHRLEGHEFGQALGVGDGQEACLSAAYTFPVGHAGMLQSMESQRVGHDQVTELN